MTKRRPHPRKLFRAPVALAPDVKRERIARAVALSATAYSYDRYRSWAAIARYLVDRGYNEFEAAAIMMSKVMRWAADADEKRGYGYHTTATLHDYLVTYPSGEALEREVRMLTLGTFGGGYVTLPGTTADRYDPPARR